MTDSKKNIHPCQASEARWPAIIIHSGTLDGLKWLAMILMTVDHVNRVYANGHVLWAYNIGRLAMPLFAFVFAYNLARSGDFLLARYIKSIKKLVFFGLLATPAYLSMMKLSGILPLNIMFTLLVSELIIFCYQRGDSKVIAVALFLLGGFLVDYSWPGMMLCLCSWLYCKNPSFRAFLVVCLAYFFLNAINGNNWALLALPIIMMASRLTLTIPRWPYFFWIYYPLHLTVLVLLRDLGIVA